MPLNIGDALSRLRHDKGISQRTASLELGISQALLSHYENGIREPRLEFIVRACDYYGVSADYIFGRAAARENPLAACEADGKLSPWEDEDMRCLIGSVSGLLALIYDVYGKKAAGCASAYLASAVYGAARAAGCLPEAEALPPAPLCDAQLKLAEAAFIAEIASSDRPGNYGSNIREEYPQLCKLISCTERHITELEFKGDTK